MTKAFKIFRAIFVSLLIIVVGIPLGLYIVMSTPWAQEKLRSIGETELSNLLGTEVRIGSVDFSPFDRIVLGDVVIKDDFKRDALKVDEISLRFELGYFVNERKLAFDYATIDGMEAWLYKPTAKGPLNIAGIIEHLKPKDKTKPPTRFELAISTVEIKNSRFRFDILDAPEKERGLDTRHIALSALELRAFIPKITNEGVAIDLLHLSAKERSGLEISDFTANISALPGNIALKNPVLTLPNSRLVLNLVEFAPEKLGELQQLGVTKPVDIRIEKGSYVTLKDFGWAVPVFHDVDRRFKLHVDASGILKDITLRHLSVEEDGGQMLNVYASAHVTGLPYPDSIQVEDLDLGLRARGNEIARLTAEMSRNLSNRAVSVINSLGDMNLSAQVSGSLKEINGKVDLLCSLGRLGFNGNASLSPKEKSGDMDALIDISNFDLGRMLDDRRLGRVTLAADIAGNLRGGRIAADGKIDIASVEYQGNAFKDIYLEGVYNPDRSFAGTVEMDNQFGRIELETSGSANPLDPQIRLISSISRLDVSSLGLKGKFDGYKACADINADLSGSLKDWVNGTLSIRDLKLEAPDAGKPSLHINKINLDADNFGSPSTIEIESDFINGRIEGDICLSTLPKDILSAVGSVLPVFGPTHDVHKFSSCDEKENRFVYNFSIDKAEELSNFFKLPVQIIYPVSIDGSMNMEKGKMMFTLDAPYLMNGEKIIENTAVQAELNYDDAPSGMLYATTQMPTKKGEMVLVTTLTAAQNRVDTRVDWMLEREKPINGILSFSTLLGKNSDGKLTADVDFNPCDITFGTDRWHISPSRISIAPGDITVGDFAMTAGRQRIAIDGRVSTDSTSTLDLDLRDVNMIAIFETLDIDKALIGGRATGRFNARGLLSRTPVITCPDLHVDSISYNYCVLGNAEVRADWDNEAQAVMLDADVTGFDKNHSHIYGSITPAKEELDINFDANRVPVGFLKPFMEAFAEDVSGHASGHAHLFGTFKYIDLEGDIYADNFGLKVGFTNTWFYCTDSVKITPGQILINNATVRDVNGNTARLNGRVDHKFFKEPSFDFKVTDAQNFLSYDVNSKLSPDWYGRIYGNGSAFISGKPGVVNINVNMSTAPNSTFTFVLSDREDADEYTFITFRDRNEHVITDSITEVDHVPAIVREYQRRALMKNADVPTDYNMDIQIDITPEANIIVVMDPVGGDEIKSNGKGSLRMTYNSSGNDLRMYGGYTIERGSYNFTLQDIIVKDFKIRSGSSINFSGDPYSAKLDIEAAYSVNANLSDLDESFLQDKDLNRTNVPVNALLKVTGDMRQPDIAFDLEFPTLTSDTYRKVRSIVSTDEMMNRQIVYLLALGRFYTPDYMSATKGNELFSMASSTISSRLSSMLGKLSENWTIAPNLRSDKGDFSDVEFDLALSSSLLNNRLRMNGNFGYRDKSLNTNQFIGDFDIEYLLNRTGTWRLKAYNRFNDQNYYLRTAQTTQGVGIMFRRDFDRMFGFLHRKKKEDTDPTDSLPQNNKSDSLPADTLTIQQPQPSTEPQKQ